jgi:hypothetical protein
LNKRQQEKKRIQRKKRHPVRLAEIAYNELLLNYSSLIAADQVRLERMMRGLRYLDDYQAEICGGVEELLEGYKRNKNAEALVVGLELLIQKPEGFSKALEEQHER